MKYTTYDELNDIQKKLVDAAWEEKETSYSPYFKFMVGAAFLTQDGEIIAASNVENAAGGSICAERAAILRANAIGKRMFDSIAIVARGEDYDTEEPTAPCGSCRQMISESAQISGKDLELILSNTNKDKVIITSINEIFPLAYGPNDMHINIDKYRK